MFGNTITPWSSSGNKGVEMSPDEKKPSRNKSAHVTRNIRASDEEWDLWGILLKNHPGGRSEASRRGIRFAMYDEIRKMLILPPETVITYKDMRECITRIRNDRVQQLRATQDEIATIDNVLEYVDALHQKDEEERAREKEQERLSAEQIRQQKEVVMYANYRKERFIRAAKGSISDDEIGPLLERMAEIREENLRTTRNPSAAEKATNTFLLTIFERIIAMTPEVIDFVRDDNEAITFTNEFLVEQLYQDASDD